MANLPLPFKKGKKGKTVPSFDRLSNPFYQTEDTKSEDITERGKLLVELRKEKAKNEVVETTGGLKQDMKKEKSRLQMTFKTPKKKICTIKNCPYCSADKCNTCPNCLDKSRHNKCVNQMCPNLNRKVSGQKPNVINRLPSKKENETSIPQVKRSDISLDCSAHQSQGVCDGDFISSPKLEESPLPEKISSSHHQILEERVSLPGGSKNFSGSRYGSVPLSSGPTSAEPVFSTGDGSIEKGLGSDARQCLRNRGSVAAEETSNGSAVVGPSSSSTKPEYSNTDIGSNKVNVEASRVSQGFSSLKTSSTKYSCEDCGKSFTYLGNLTSHMEKHCRKANIKINCPSCNLKILKKSLARHLLTHRQEKLKCSTCEMKFRSKEKLLNHERNHPVKTCRVCNKKFRRPFLLKIHEREVHGESTKPSKVKVKHECKDCGIVFNRPGRLMRHQEEKHGRSPDSSERLRKPFKCRYCGMEVISDKSLKTHLITEHSTEGHKCELCDKFFFNSKSLKKHAKFHDAISSNAEVKTAVLDNFVTNDLGEAIVINHAPLPAGTVVLDTVADGIDSQHGMTASYEVVCSTNGQIAHDPSDILAALAGQGEVYFIDT